MKWIIGLVMYASALFLAGHFYGVSVGIHPTYNLMLAFFFIQVLVLIRIDKLIPEQWRVQASLIKIVVRFLSALILILVLMLTHEDLVRLTIQFFVLYLAFMIFEITMALANLRRN